MNKELSDKEIIEATAQAEIIVSIEKEWSKQDDADCAHLRQSKDWKTLLRVRDRMKQEALQEAMNASAEEFEYLKAAICSFESFTVFIDAHAKLAGKTQRR